VKILTLRPVVVACGTNYRARPWKLRGRDMVKFGALGAYVQIMWNWDRTW
jgi:hypothetical protein